MPIALRLNAASVWAIGLSAPAGTGERPSELPDLEHHQRGLGVGAGQVDQRVDGCRA